MKRDEYDALWMRPHGLPLTGQGRTLAIIDQPLWKESPAYRSNLANDIGKPIEGESMHGAAVTSIAVGNLGVAPNAKIAYCAIETWHGRETLLKNHAQALRDLQAYVKAGNNIDAVSTSHGWMPHEEGSQENNNIIYWFEKRNIPVFSSLEKFIYMCGLQGAATTYLERSNPVPSCREDQVAIPVDNRLIANRNQHDIDANGGNFYCRIQTGGMSWAIPFVAGLFTLARESKQDISRQEFFYVLSKTARLVDFGNGCHLPTADINAFCNEVISCPMRRDRGALLNIRNYINQPRS